MATIAEIRQQYPEYQDLTDEQIAKGLHAKFYADMPYEQFASKVGLGANKPETSLVGSAIQAAGTAAGRAAANVIGLPGSIGQMITNSRPEGMPGYNAVDLIGSALSYLPNQEQVKNAMFAGSGTPEYKPDSSLGNLAMEGGVGALTGLLMPMGLSMPSAAGYGAVSGVGGELAGQATEGTAIEPYARVAGSVLAPAVSSALMNYGTNLVRGAMGTRSTQADLDAKIAGSLAAEGQTPQQMQAVMANADRTGATLANRNAALGSETVMAAQETPAAAQVARQAANRDMQASFGRIRERLATVLPAVKGDVASARGEILQTMDDTAAPLYREFQRTTGTSGFTETQPRNALKRLFRTNPDVVQRVLKDAVRVDKPISGIRITDSGVLDTRGATLNDLNRVIDGIDGVLYGTDDLAKSFQTSTGRPNQQASILMDVRSKLNDFIRSKSPDQFALANDIYSSGHRMRRAVQEGFDALSETRGLGEAEAFFNTLNKGEREAFKSGLAGRLLNSMDVSALTPNSIEKMTSRLSPFLGRGNSDRVRAILNNERTVQEAAKRIQSVMPQASGFGGDTAQTMARVAGGVAASPRSTIAESAAKLADRVLTGRGPEYYNQLNTELVRATTSSNAREASRLLQGIIKRQAEAVRAASELRRAGIAGAVTGDGQQ